MRVLTVRWKRIRRRRLATARLSGAPSHSWMVHLSLMCDSSAPHSLLRRVGTPRENFKRPLFVEAGFIFRTAPAICRSLRACQASFDLTHSRKFRTQERRECHGTCASRQAGEVGVYAKEKFSAREEVKHAHHSVCSGLPPARCRMDYE